MMSSTWGDALGGFLYGGIVCRLFIWHATFSINSLAHWIGYQKYSLFNSSHGNTFLAFLTMGEGHHNFHHEFPSDYRNGIEVFDYDPTKWAIKACELLGLASSLKVTPENEIKKTELETQRIKLEKEMSNYNWGSKILQEITFDEFQSLVSTGRKLFILDGYVLEFSNFHHPGGFEILNSKVGQDVSLDFHKLAHPHTLSAILKSHLQRVAKLV